VDANEMLKTNAYDLMHGWKSKAMLSRQAHYDSANYYSRLHLWFGIPVIALTTLVGTGAFASLQESPNITLRLLAGILGVISAILASLQTFFNYQGLGEKHRNSANKYSALVREMEMHIQMPVAYADMAKLVDEWRIKYDSVQEESPSVPQRIWLSTIQKPDVSVDASKTGQPSSE